MRQASFGSPARDSDLAKKPRGTGGRAEEERNGI
jgi:hypothetical protein